MRNLLNNYRGQRKVVSVHPSLRPFRTLFFLLILESAFGLRAQTYSVDWFKVSDGGGTSTGGIYSVSDTIGQADAGGPMQGGGFSVEGGFWSLYADQTLSAEGSAPAIITQPRPSGQFVYMDAPVSYSVSVTGAGPLFYQWQDNGTNISDGELYSGTTTSNLFLNTSQFIAGGTYCLIIESAYGSVTSSVVKVSLLPFQYSATDLGSLSGSNGSAALGINNSGQVVGYSSTSNGYSHAFLYNGGNMSDLGTLGGGSESYSEGINDSGQVVGYAFTSDGLAHAFLYSGGALMDLGTLQGPSGVSYAYGINSSGQIVGSSSTVNDSTPHAFLYSDGTMTDFGSEYLDSGPIFESVAYGINDSGQIVGQAEIHSASQPYAFVYSGLQVNSLGTFGGFESVGYRINNNGQVIGYSDTKNGLEHAFLYSGGTLTDLSNSQGPIAISYATGINNNGQVVGNYAGNASKHAFLYTGGAVLDLNGLLNTNIGTYLYDAGGINDLGQIAASGANGHAFLLTLLPSTGRQTTNLIDQTYGIGAGSFELGNFNTNTALPTAENPVRGQTGGLNGGWSMQNVVGNTVTGWICTSNVNWNWNRSQNADGSKNVELGANAYASGIYTTLSLNAGTTYTLSFALSSTPTYNPGVVQVTFGTAVQSFTNSATTSYADMQWETEIMTFTPTSTGSYQLQFYHPLFGSVPEIDAVSVIAAGSANQPSLASQLQPQIQSTSVSGTNITFTWNQLAVYPPVSYQVQYRTNLTSGNWNNLGGIITNGTWSFTDTVTTDAQRFYRVLLVQ